MTGRGRPRAVPSSRISRLTGLGGLATGIAGATLSEGARRLARGERPSLRDLVLTPSNATRFADRLARMRGAAMKVGQLLSMEAGDMLPPELAPILARLRAEADYMPPRQLKGVLIQAWGKDWLRQFRSFDPRPVAAASIGQVHRAQTRDGRTLAIKVQYPGVRRSIDSDVDNVATLIRAAGLIPPGMEIAPLLKAAKEQLHDEADYRREAAQMARFGALLRDDPGFLVPAPQDDLTTDTVLAMTWANGTPIEAAETADQDVRDLIASRLIELTLRELFQFNLAQTDPNFANYLFDDATGKVVLLDFGAAREIPAQITAGYRAMLIAAEAKDRAAVASAAEGIGLISSEMAAHHVEAILQIIDTVLTALHRNDVFDFGDGAFLTHLREMGMDLGADRTFQHVPPADVLFLHRKIGGTYLLAHRLGARVQVGVLLKRWAGVGLRSEA